VDGIDLGYSEENYQVGVMCILYGNNLACPLIEPMNFPASIIVIWYLVKYLSEKLDWVELT
jgi:hypothetical protein